MNSSVGLLRDLAEAQLIKWNLESVLDEVLLVVSELATNAIRINPGLVIGLELYTLPGVVMVELWDPSLTPPCRREAADDDEAGRGLSIVDFIADDWGCRWPPTGGKTVWARVPARRE